MSNTQHVQTGFAELNGTTLYYEVAGAGHPFVLVHGHLLDRRSWDDQFAVFAGRYRVIRYDQRGFGDSGLITKGESYSDRQDLYALMKFLGIERAYLMGVSGGGALAIDFTLEHPEMVDALIPVTAGVSGFRPTEEDKQKHPDVVRMYTSLNEAFERHDIARAVVVIGFAVQNRQQAVSGTCQDVISIRDASTNPKVTSVRSQFLSRHVKSGTR